MLESLIYDWNKIGAPAKPPRVMLDDETLRDGLQSPSVRTPTIEQKIKILHLIDAARHRHRRHRPARRRPARGRATSSGWPARSSTPS